MIKKLISKFRTNRSEKLRPVTISDLIPDNLKHLSPGDYRRRPPWHGKK